MALATEALKAAGAQARPRPRKDFPSRGDYVWGDQVLLVEGKPGAPVLTGSIDDVKPGDIAQFRDAKFPKSRLSHHTAVVTGITREKLFVLQENFGGKRFVTAGSFRIDRLSEGWLRVYRPVPAGTSNR